MQQVSSFKQVCFEKNLRIAGFLESVVLYANIGLPFKYW